MDTASEQDHARVYSGGDPQWSCALSIWSQKLYRISAPLAQRHHDRRVALHRLLHDRRGAEAAPDDLVESECVHVDNSEIDALTCRHYGMSCIALAIVVCNRLAALHLILRHTKQKPTEARLYCLYPTLSLYALSFRVWKLARVEPARRVRALFDLS